MKTIEDFVNELSLNPRDTYCIKNLFKQYVREGVVTRELLQYLQITNENNSWDKTIETCNRLFNKACADYNLTNISLKTIILPPYRLVLLINNERYIGTFNLAEEKGFTISGPKLGNFFRSYLNALEYSSRGSDKTNFIIQIDAKVETLIGLNDITRNYDISIENISGQLFNMEILNTVDKYLDIVQVQTYNIHNFSGYCFNLKTLDMYILSISKFSKPIADLMLAENAIRRSNVKRGAKLAVRLPDVRYLIGTNPGHKKSIIKKLRTMSDYIDFEIGYVKRPKELMNIVLDDKYVGSTKDGMGYSWK